ncbi:50S ribosomal protein L35 [Rickettsia endosymbiont of Cardiosporidium cionae]|uniref:50S ribosomal protein L35 n=1 Tax=Rickettsia endosymbiont of Cardiosporidium cionae TaxID=2777155 RepID=UPI0018959CAB|nr:50S ribosomal protein L35 [Rickettsia endosymbiont of Cardiosporidium cionae]KAF8818550.1 50S ribosomal protein L35 [Rickettsia endosymbiont of Cardiosporidium cionae]
MYKIKNHSGASKRFRMTSTGKIKFAQSGKKHLMRRRSKTQIRDKRKVGYLIKADSKRLSRTFIPVMIH